MEKFDPKEVMGKLLKTVDGSYAVIAADLSQDSELACISQPLVGIRVFDSTVIPFMWHKNGSPYNSFDPDKSDIAGFANGNEFENFKAILVANKLNFAKSNEIPVTYDGANGQNFIVSGHLPDGTYVLRSNGRNLNIRPEKITGLKYADGNYKPYNGIDMDTVANGAYCMDSHGCVVKVLKDLRNNPILAEIHKPLIGMQISHAGFAYPKLFMTDGRSSTNIHSESSIVTYAMGAQKEQAFKVISEQTLASAYENNFPITWNGATRSYNIIGKTKDHKYICDDSGRIKIVEPDAKLFIRAVY